jgi:hypothetical protein
MDEIPPFPLTPALSLGERVKLGHVLNGLYVFGINPATWHHDKECAD